MYTWEHALRDAIAGQWTGDDNATILMPLENGDALPVRITATPDACRKFMTSGIYSPHWHPVLKHPVGRVFLF